MSISDNNTLQTIGMASAAASTVVALLALKYNDRPLFYEHIEGIPHKKGVPFLGGLSELLNNVYRIHDFQTEGFEQLDALT
jgi:hypothetical protein